MNGLDFSSYYIFYGGLFFGLIWVTGLRWLYERTTGLVLRALGRQPPRAPGRLRRARSTRSRTRCSTTRPTRATSPSATSR